MSNYRFAQVTLSAKDGADAANQIGAYLPSSYWVSDVAHTDLQQATVTITGEDSAGWTLDDYVIPRLASGLYFAHEVK